MDLIIEEINKDVNFYGEWAESYMKELGEMKINYNSLPDKRKEDARDLQKRMTHRMNLIVYYELFQNRLSSIRMKILDIQYNENKEKNK